MIIVTFLGTGKYTSTTYVWNDDRTCTTCLFPVALAQWLEPSEMKVLLTKEAKAHNNWRELQSQLDCKVTPVDIPDGRSEEELWRLFEKLTEKPTEKLTEKPTMNLSSEEVVFDITHGFRSLPVFALLAAAFLQIARGVQLKHIVYGAYEARDNQNRALVFDLRPFLTLLEWTTATDQFIKTGDARRIAHFLTEEHQALRRAGRSEEQEELPKHLKSLGKQIETVSLALGMMRPREALPEAHKLMKKLNEAKQEVYRWVPPCTVLLERVRDTYQSLAVAQPETDLDAHLQGQLQLIKWHRERQQYVAAVSLAREWMVSIVCGERGLDWTKTKDREQVECDLNEATRPYCSMRDAQPEQKEATQASKTTSHLSDPDFLKLWSELCDLRNDISHCGMRDQPQPTEKLKKNIEERLDRLRELAQ
jgi:CRISPR-associated DxTHG motif protein